MDWNGALVCCTSSIMQDMKAKSEIYLFRGYCRTEQSSVLSCSRELTHRELSLRNRDVPNVSISTYFSLTSEEFSGSSLGMRT